MADWETLFEAAGTALQVNPAEQNGIRIQRKLRLLAENTDKQSQKCIVYAVWLCGGDTPPNFYPVRPNTRDIGHIQVMKSFLNTHRKWDIVGGVIADIIRGLYAVHGLGRYQLNLCIDYGHSSPPKLWRTRVDSNSFVNQSMILRCREDAMCPIGSIVLNPMFQSRPKGAPRPSPFTDMIGGGFAPIIEIILYMSLFDYKHPDYVQLWSVITHRDLVSDPNRAWLSGYNHTSHATNDDLKILSVAVAVSRLRRVCRRWANILANPLAIIKEYSSFTINTDIVFETMRLHIKRPNIPIYYSVPAIARKWENVTTKLTVTGHIARATHRGWQWESNGITTTYRDCAETTYYKIVKGELVSYVSYADGIKISYTNIHNERIICYCDKEVRFILKASNDGDLHYYKYISKTTELLLNDNMLQIYVSGKLALFASEGSLQTTHPNGGVHITANHSFVKQFGKHGKELQSVDWAAAGPTTTVEIFCPVMRKNLHFTKGIKNMVDLCMK